jgi:hypothetical protein
LLSFFSHVKGEEVPKMCVREICIEREREKEREREREREREGLNAILKVNICMPVQ